jgi:hypothetical protein
MPYLKVAIVFGLGTALLFGVAALLLKGLDRLTTRRPRPDHCSFCDRHTRDVGTLIPAPGLNICRACIQLLTDMTPDNCTSERDAPSRATATVSQTARCRVCGISVPGYASPSPALCGLLCRPCLAIVQKTERLFSGSSDA